MGTNRHAYLTDTELHIPYIKTFADAAARTGDATTYITTDLYKKAIQLDTMVEYVLTGIDPTVWTELPNGGDTLATSLGAQEDIYRDKTGDTLNFRSIGPDNEFSQFTSSTTEVLVQVLHEYDAIVSTDVTEGTHTTVTAALASGAKSIFVKSGTYNEPAGWTLPEGTLIQGEGISDVNVYFDESGFITIDGTGTLESAGTIGVTTGFSDVTGVGTTFTNLNDGDFIHIDGAPYPIESITDNTNLIIKPPYWGPTRTGITNWWGASRLLGIQIYGLTLRDALGDYNIVADQAVNVRIRDVVFVDGGINLSRCSEVNISSCVFTIQTGDAIRIRNYSEGVRIEGVLVRTPAKNGIIVATNSQKISIQGTSIFHAGDAGFIMDATAYDVSLGGVSALHCDGPGFTLIGESVSASNCTAKGNNGVGFSVESSILSGCSADDNTSHGISVEAASVGAVISGGKTINNGSLLTIYGIRVNAGANDTVISANYLGGNSGGPILDGGTNTLYAGLNRP
jgi:hypothetical protein